ncbi:alpha/beta hydrolase [Corynebacterium endometrii]|uniref:Tripeptidyl aminopeptidase n=1 Tax=Corynebacterium endometrii TaxID=2488819 RepID=A0A4P7QHK6_9CORY|nr:alpha/beta hydrolase [Corynebacterium endometrii]QCB29175.1 Tripeptidyl aminopeptidase precursor [Corynebacterium endometrii]
MFSPARKITAALASAAATAALLTIGAATAPAAAAAPAITWEDCPEQVTVPGAECGRVEVPTYYDHPERGTISVGFVRVKASNPSAKRGTLFTNPGGPGGDAYSYVGHDSIPWPDAVTAEWDRVAVQPRGLPGSTPLDCTKPGKGATVLDQLFRGGAWNRASCEEGTPGYTRAITTENTARDWEMVRQALQLEKISIVGLSYGTFLGSVYATLFPHNTDRVVLDSAMSPSLAWNGVLVSQQRGYEKAMEDFFSYVARNNDTYKMGTTPLQVYERWSYKVASESGVRPTALPPRAKIGDLPPGLEFAGQPGVHIMNATGQLRVEAEHLADKAANPAGNQILSTTLSLTRQIIPQPTQWEMLANHISNREPIDLGTPSQEQALEAFMAQAQATSMQAMILCNENTVAGNPALLPEYYWSALVTYDPFRSLNAAYGSGQMCEGTPPHTKAPALNGSQLAVRPLQISATGDPQTPYAYHGEMARQMGASVVTVDGPGHGHFANGNATVDAIVTEYLRTGSATAQTVPGVI